MCIITNLRANLLMSFKGRVGNDDFLLAARSIGGLYVDTRMVTFGCSS